MKPYHPLVLLAGLVITGLGVYFISGSLANHILASKPDNVPTICSGWHPTHVVKIRQNIVNPGSVRGKVCDKLQIINHDDVLREMAFGEHEHHQAYDDIYEQDLSKNQSFTITLNQAGAYRFHDHFDDTVHGTFVVVQ